MKIGIIGAGNISLRHIKGYQQNPDCEVVAISDINAEQAQKIAQEYQIQQVYTDYHDILNDPTIDAVSIATPTFTHKEIALAAIKSNKHVLCEKPPALNADEVKEIRQALAGSDKVFMFALVTRFRKSVQQLKEYIDSGKMGPIICADMTRLTRMVTFRGWFTNRSLGGGVLRDGAIHEIDLLLYLMGYPKPKSVSAFWSRINNDLPTRLKETGAVYPSADKNTYKNDTEDIIKGFINLENGANLTVKSGNIFLSCKPEVYAEINGQNAGALLQLSGSDKGLKIVEVTNEDTLNETAYELCDDNMFWDEINHFVDCCQNKTECLVKVDEAVTLMEIIDALYASAQSGETITF